MSATATARLAITRHDLECALMHVPISAFYEVPHNRLIGPLWEALTGLREHPPCLPGCVENRQRNGTPEPWCNHDPAAVRNGVCECGTRVGPERSN